MHTLKTFLALSTLTWSTLSLAEPCNKESVHIFAQATQKLASGEYVGGGGQVEYKGMIYRVMLVKPAAKDGFDKSSYFQMTRNIAGYFNPVGIVEITGDDGFPGKAVSYVECEKSEPPVKKATKKK